MGEGRNSVLHFIAELAFLLQWLKGQEVWSSRKMKTVDEIVPWELFTEARMGMLFQ